MSAIKVEAYKTSDGKLFPSEEDATIYQRNKEFKDWYDNSTSFNLGRMEPPNYTHMIKWLADNRVEVEKFYSMTKIKKDNKNG